MLPSRQTQTLPTVVFTRTSTAPLRATPHHTLHSTGAGKSPSKRGSALDRKMDAPLTKEKGQGQGDGGNKRKLSAVQTEAEKAEEERRKARQARFGITAMTESERQELRKQKFAA